MASTGDNGSRSEYGSPWSDVAGVGRCGRWMSVPGPEEIRGKSDES